MNNFDLKDSKIKLNIFSSADSADVLISLKQKRTKDGVRRLCKLRFILKRMEIKNKYKNNFSSSLMS